MGNDQRKRPTNLTKYIDLFDYKLAEHDVSSVPTEHYPKRAQRQYAVGAASKAAHKLSHLG